MYPKIGDRVKTESSLAKSPSGHFYPLAEDRAVTGTIQEIYCDGVVKIYCEKEGISLWRKNSRLTKVTNLKEIYNV